MPRFAFSLVVLALFAGHSLADLVFGEILKFDEAKKTLTIVGTVRETKGKKFTFRVADHCEFFDSKTPATAAILEPGREVHVTYAGKPSTATLIRSRPAIAATTSMLIRVDPRQRIIEVGQKSYRVVGYTKITERDQEIAIGDLVPGRKVMVQYNDRTRVAEEVRMEPGTTTAKERIGQKDAAKKKP